MRGISHTFRATARQYGAAPPFSGSDVQVPQMTRRPFPLELRSGRLGVGKPPGVSVQGFSSGGSLDAAATYALVWVQEASNIAGAPSSVRGLWKP